jgi:hypothetical protein
MDVSDFQDGGKRRKMSKKASKKASKKSSRKLLDGGKRKASKKGSKKGSRKMKREMPKPMQDVMELKNKIKKDNADIKDGPGLTTVCWGLYKEANNDAAKAFDKYKSMKDKFAKMVEDKTREMAAKRAAKKASA